MLIDTHCHLTFPEIWPQVADVLSRAREAGVTRVCHVSTHMGELAESLSLLQRFDNVYLIAGIHPHEAGKITDADIAALADVHAVGRALPADTDARRIVAVGEAGLDFHYDFAPRDRQEQVFRTQIELACAVNRPLVIHAREAEERVCDILAEYPQLAGRFVFHCFSSGIPVTRRILDLGGRVSFTGVVTFKNAATVREAARYVPAERLFVETDAPYLSPVPVRKIFPNEPAFVSHTARFLAELRGEPFTRFTAQTTRNAIDFFQLPEQQT